MTDEQPYQDPLTVAITGEPIPDAARGDETYLREHTEAVRDLALLRAHLGTLADELTGASPEDRSLTTAPRDGRSVEDGRPGGSAARDAGPVADGESLGGTTPAGAGGRAEPGEPAEPGPSAESTAADPAATAAGSGSTDPARTGQRASSGERAPAGAGAASDTGAVPGSAGGSVPEGGSSGAVAASGSAGAGAPGEDAGAGPGSPAALGRPWWRPVKSRTVALRAIGVACGLAVFGTVLWLGPLGGTGGGEQDAAKSASDTGAGDDGGSGSMSPEGMVACSSLIVEGTVETVEDLSGMDRITVKVTRYYKPADGGSRVVFPMDQNVDPRLKKGDHTLITIPKDDAAPENWATGKDIADLRKTVREALPGAAKTKCED
ncbi:hypothetical protein DY218_20250 [Streptomyces triticagri]|uniref:Uncharacterized protein n=1 Tax=Streptomyces triticagri TaxID=2293568 RepID=A0A372M222_9ACTN|nr:hypothetical protein [Streptomyces triticagri]RFU84879.1 hypothetical protein DY218_20250 [Streptomyces triticagri]